MQKARSWRRSTPLSDDKIGTLDTEEKIEVVWKLFASVCPHLSLNFRKGWEIGKVFLPPPLAGLSRQDGMMAFAAGKGQQPRWKEEGVVTQKCVKPFWDFSWVVWFTLHLSLQALPQAKLVQHTQDTYWKQLSTDPSGGVWSSGSWSSRPCFANMH